MAFIVDHVELWVVHLTWSVETDPAYPFAERVLSRPVVSYDPALLLLALELWSAIDDDRLTTDLAAQVRRHVIFTIKILREMKGLSLADAKGLLGRLEEMGDARHEPGAISRTLSSLGVRTTDR
ncbi:MAG: hypothetical protein J0L92_09345 [Deltaproteobacteria bacterium]|nr:hypothetical protein [Deltaproteobacteria bacterium]